MLKNKNKIFNKKLEKIADELIFDNEDTWKFLEEHNLGMPDTECGVVEEIWSLVMDALVRGYYVGKENKIKRREYKPDLEMERRAVNARKEWADSKGGEDDE